jgi:Glycosyl transferase family 2
MKAHRMINPLVSIVINNYNYGRYVGQAIQSALDQTYPNVEVIVVDDGSIDESAKVILSFGSRVRAIFKANGGQASSYNSGFAESRGDLVLFLDADDFLIPTALEEVVPLFDSDGIAKVHYYLDVADGNGSSTGAAVPTGELSRGDLKNALLASGNYLTPPASGNIYSRSAVARILPMPEMGWRFGADTWPIYLTPLLGEVRACPKALGVYRVHGANHGAATTIDGVGLRDQLAMVRRRDDMLADFCSAHGIPYHRGTVQKHFVFQKLRLASLVVDPLSHPYPGDTRAKAALAAIRACLRYEGSSAIKKVVMMVWIVAVAVLPRAWTRSAVTSAFVPARRSGVANRFVSASSR